MSESGDYEPQDWGTGTSFADARAAYDADAGRSYDEAKARGVTASDVLPESLSTQSTKPFIVVPDLTGSMSDRPGVMFGKMPYMWNEIEKEYLGSDAEVAFVGVQDDGDNYPLQAQPFGQGEDLRVALAKLVIEGGGQVGEAIGHGLDVRACRCSAGAAWVPCRGLSRLTSVAG